MIRSYRRINVSTLKAKLSSYLRLVQTAFREGESRQDTFISPIDPHTALTSIHGKKLKGQKTDIVAILMEDREGS